MRLKPEDKRRVRRHLRVAVMLKTSRMDDTLTSAEKRKNGRKKDGWNY